jgi:hypothetical protein
MHQATSASKEKTDHETRSEKKPTGIPGLFRKLSLIANDYEIKARNAQAEVNEDFKTLRGLIEGEFGGIVGPTMRVKLKNRPDDLKRFNDLWSRGGDD